MNSQFSTGFVIALVIGIAVGALWPKYGIDLSDTALGRRHDAQAVSYALTNGEQGGRGCSGDCDESSNGRAARGAGHGKSGHGKSGHGNSGRGQGGRGCRGDCDESSNAVAVRGTPHGESGRGMGRHGRTTFASIVNDGCREQQADSVKLKASTTCRESRGQNAAKTTCSGEDNYGKTLTAGRCNVSGQDQAVSASKTEDQTQEQCQHGRERDIEDSMAEHRGPGRGTGLGVGRGWGRDFEMADATATDVKALAAEKD